MDLVRTGLSAAKFRDARVTAKGEERASVRLTALRTLWLNTGTLCNIACAGCYIESSPRNDALLYLERDEAARFLAEAPSDCEIGFTGGEPFLNPHFLDMLNDALTSGRRVLVLTNAMRPMMRPKVRARLLALREAYGERLLLRVSLDRPDAEAHDRERGPGTFAKTLRGIDWLAAHRFRLAIAGRLWGGDEAGLRDAFGTLFRARGWPLDAQAPAALVLFPEMDARADPPEITTACWTILGKDPNTLMCASSRMVVHRRGEPEARVVACTLLPYDPGFDLGESLAQADRPVALNHPHCAKFCVLGGGKCTA